MTRVDYSSRKLSSEHSIMNASKFDGFFNGVISDLASIGNEYGFPTDTYLSSNHYSGDRLTADEWQELIGDLRSTLEKAYSDTSGGNLDYEFRGLLDYLAGLTAGQEVRQAEWNWLVDYTQAALNAIIDYYEG